MHLDSPSNMVLDTKHQVTDASFIIRDDSAISSLWRSHPPVDHMLFPLVKEMITKVWKTNVCFIVWNLIRNHIPNLSMHCSGNLDLFLSCSTDLWTDGSSRMNASFHFSRSSQRWTSSSFHFLGFSSQVLPAVTIDFLFHDLYLHGWWTHGGSVHRFLFALHGSWWCGRLCSSCGLILLHSSSWMTQALKKASSVNNPGSWNRRRYSADRSLNGLSWALRPSSLHLSFLSKA